MSRGVEEIRRTRQFFDELAPGAVTSPLAPTNLGRYLAALYDAALLPLLRREKLPVRLLDFGCGSGIFVIRVQDCTRQAVGLDISGGLLRQARQLARGGGRRIPWVQFDGLRIPFIDGAFNRIVTRDSLCHVPDGLVAEVLRELARVMEWGGRFYLLEQVSESEKWQLEWERKGITPWLKRRGVDELIRLFQGAGFRLESAVAVRQPRFPWIFPVRFRLFPWALIPHLARLELIWNRALCPVRTRRWQQDLFVFRRRGDGD